MNQNLEQVLEEIFGVKDIPTLKSIDELGIYDLSDLVGVTEIALCQAGVPDAKAYQILAKYGKKKLTLDRVIFAAFVAIRNVQGDKKWLFGQYGWRFLDENLWLDVGIDLSELTTTDLLFLRIIVGRYPFTPRVIGRLIKGRDSQAIDAINLFGDDDESFAKKIGSLIPGYEQTLDFAYLESGGAKDARLAWFNE